MCALRSRASPALQVEADLRWAKHGNNTNHFYLCVIGQTNCHHGSKQMENGMPLEMGGLEYHHH